jgi:hypothetical protein
MSRAHFGRKVCGNNGCDQVHFLFPSQHQADAIRDSKDPVMDGHDMFIAGDEDRQEQCSKCEGTIYIPPKEALSW